MRIAGIRIDTYQIHSFTPTASTAVSEDPQAEQVELQGKVLLQVLKREKAHDPTVGGTVEVTTAVGPFGWPKVFA